MRLLLDAGLTRNWRAARRVRRVSQAAVIFFASALPGLAQLAPATAPAGAGKTAGANAADTSLKVPSKVEVAPVARDDQIKRRLQNILAATEWFDKPAVEVRDGVVFLSGTAETEPFKSWAGDLARTTQDVAAVVNRMDVRTNSLFDLSPAQAELRGLWASFIASAPYFFSAIVILALSWWGSRRATSASRRIIQRRVASPLLRDVFARSLGILLFVLGCYLVLHVSGLSRLAVTVLGGTGLLGLIIGIAFRDITENFLASIFLSIQRPFEPDDMVQIGDDTGYVQGLNTRTTVLITLDGNYVQIPNATVYKATIRNFTSNPNRRENFAIGIGYKDSIADAQDIALRVLAEHPAILKEPEPWALVDNLGSAAVNLRIYFWLDGHEHGWLKVKSSVIRLVKQAFEEHGISIPFEARQTLPSPDVEHPRRSRKSRDQRSNGRASHRIKREMLVSTPGEAQLCSEAATLQAQAERAPPPEGGDGDLLRASPAEQK